VQLRSELYLCLQAADGIRDRNVTGVQTCGLPISFKLKQVFREMWDAGSAIFFATHVLDVVEKLCDKIAIIKGGKLIASGDIDAELGRASCRGRVRVWGRSGAAERGCRGRPAQRDQ